MNREGARGGNYTLCNGIAKAWTRENRGSVRLVFGSWDKWKSEEWKMTAWNKLVSTTMQEKSGGVGCLGMYLTARGRVAHVTRVGHGVGIKLSEVGAGARYGKIRDEVQGNQSFQRAVMEGWVWKRERKEKERAGIVLV